MASSTITPDPGQPMAAQISYHHYPFPFLFSQASCRFQISQSQLIVLQRRKTRMAEIMNKDGDAARQRWLYFQQKPAT
jgi:hypothetical protein